jgi:hypothetical protein
MGAEFEDSEEKALGELVLGYLEEHPQAMETLEGIADWCERREIRMNVKELAHALEVLTERGVLEVIGTGATRRYRKRRAVKDVHNHTPEDERRIREAALDETLAGSFPASDPPSSLPNPDEHDAEGSGVEAGDESRSRRDDG